MKETFNWPKGERVFQRDLVNDSPYFIPGAYMLEVVEEAENGDYKILEEPFVQGITLFNHYFDYPDPAAYLKSRTKV